MYMSLREPSIETEIFPQLQMMYWFHRFRFLYFLGFTAMSAIVILSSSGKTLLSFNAS